MSVTGNMLDELQIFMSFCVYHFLNGEQIDMLQTLVSFRVLITSQASYMSDIHWNADSCNLRANHVEQITCQSFSRYGDLSIS